MDRQIVLRRIAKRDLEWARELRNNNREFFFDNRFISQEQQERWYKALDYPFFVIEYNGKAAGTIAVREKHGQFEVHNVIVDQNYQRKGILKQVISILERKYRAPLYVDVQIKNKGAVEAYKKLGFSAFSCRMKKK